jgi:anti-sigma B factor antagonist
MIAPHTITASGGLEITVHRDEATTIVALKGRIDIDSSPPLRDRLLALLQETSRETVIVDLGNVLYIDSSGIATLIEGLKVALQRQRVFCLRGLEGRVLHLFEVTGMLTLFDKSGCGSASWLSKVS